MTRKKIKSKNIKAPDGFYPISGLEGRYSINKNGEVFSHARGIIKKTFKNKKNGYPSLIWNTNKKYISKSIHRIVAQTFIPNPENKKEVNHIDGDKENFKINNLEWVTKEENILHARNHFFYTPCFKNENELEKHLINKKLSLLEVSKYDWYLNKYNYSFKKEYFLETTRKLTYKEQQMVLLMDEFKKNIPLIASILDVGSEAIYVRIRNMGYKLYYCLYKNGLLIHKIEQGFKDRGNYK